MATPRKPATKPEEAEAAQETQALNPDPSHPSNKDRRIRVHRGIPYVVKETYLDHKNVPVDVLLVTHTTVDRWGKEQVRTLEKHIKTDDADLLSKFDPKVADKSARRIVG